MANVIQKLRAMPEEQKKFVFYALLVLAALVMGTFSIVSLKQNLASLSESISTINFPVIETLPPPETVSETKLQQYVNKQQHFMMTYPNGWTVSKESSDGSEVWLEKKTGDDVAYLHLEIASQTQKITTAERGIDKSIVQLKTIVQPKTSIEVGPYKGYEVVGTTCVKNCMVLAQAEYAPFSIIYFDSNGKVFKIKYAEGTVQAWDTDWTTWKEYDEFKTMLTTFAISQ